MRKNNFFIILSALITFVFLGSCTSPKKKSNNDFTTVNVSSSNLKNNSFILFYRNMKKEDKRIDFKLNDSGKTQIKIKDTLDVMTNFNVIVKGKTSKSKVIGDYKIGSFAVFFASNKSKVDLNLVGFDKAGVLRYTIGGKGNEKINKQVVAFNKQLSDSTIQRKKLEEQIDKYSLARFPNMNSGKKARKAAKKQLEKDSKYIQLINSSSNLYTLDEYLRMYVQRSNNDFAAFLLYHYYQKHLFDSKNVQDLLAHFSKTLNFEYLKQTKILLKARTRFVVGNKISDLKGETLDGTKFDLSTSNKKYVLVDFWATWCGPCKKGLPDMKKFYEKNKSKLDIVSVCCNDTEKKWRVFFKKNPQYNWNQLLDVNSKFVKHFNIEVYPTKMIVDKDGTIVYRILGEDPNSYKKMQSIIDKD